MSHTLSGHILGPQGFVAGTMELDGSGRVRRITGAPVAASALRDSGQPLVLPGFIDLHVHGGGGRDIMEGGGAASWVAQCHAAHGTTALLATTMTAPMADLETAFTGLRSSCDERPARGARVLGVHLEGPYINPGKLGAQPDFARPVSMEELARLDAIAPIRLITLAPEMPGNMEQVKALSEAGYHVQLGHTLGSYEDGVQALALGARGFTHLFNAMTPLHHRAPGLVGAGLTTDGVFNQLIPDEVHLHPAMLKLVARAKGVEETVLITDASTLTGLPDGTELPGFDGTVRVAGNALRGLDGTLIGSNIHHHQGLLNTLRASGIGFERGISMATSSAAKSVLLENEIGSLLPGCRASFNLINPTTLELHAAVVRGRLVAASEPFLNRFPEVGQNLFVPKAERL